MHLAKFLASCLHHASFRVFRFDLAIFPYFTPFYFTPSDREYLKNVKVLRDYMKTLIKKRR